MLKLKVSVVHFFIALYTYTHTYICTQWLFYNHTLLYTQLVRLLQGKYKKKSSCIVSMSCEICTVGAEVSSHPISYTAVTKPWSRPTVSITLRKQRQPLFFRHPRAIHRWPSIHWAEFGASLRFTTLSRKTGTVFCLLSPLFESPLCFVMNSVTQMWENAVDLPENRFLGWRNCHTQEKLLSLFLFLSLSIHSPVSLYLKIMFFLCGHIITSFLIA